jgi:DNA-binding transcriptional MerR regulator
MALRIGELAKRTGVKTSALRFYEAEGLLGPAARSAAGYRLYEPAALGRVAFIQRAKNLGLPLDQIRRLIESPKADVSAERAALRHLVAHKLVDTKRRIEELTTLEQELERLYVRLARTPGPDCGHVGDCACWLPTEKEVNLMKAEIDAVDACSCDGCDCAGAQCPCCGCKSA